MAKAVAVDGNVEAKATTSQNVPSDAQVGTGSWSAGDVTTVPYKVLTIDGKPAIYEAKCVFTYSGGQQAADPKIAYTTPTTEKVTLTAGKTLFQRGESGVLVDGDSAEGKKYKNKLTVSAQHKLSTD